MLSWQVTGFTFTSLPFTDHAQNWGLSIIPKHSYIMSLRQEVSNCNLTALHKELISFDPLEFVHWGVWCSWLQAVRQGTHHCVLLTINQANALFFIQY